jgi:hypothetical protein
MRARLGDAAACRPRASGSQRPWCARAGWFWKMCSVGAQDGLNGAKCRSLRPEALHKLEGMLYDALLIVAAQPALLGLHPAVVFTAFPTGCGSR